MSIHVAYMYIVVYNACTCTCIVHCVQCIVHALCTLCTSIVRELLNEDVVKRLIRHEAQPCALSGLETTSEFNNSP